MMLFAIKDNLTHFLPPFTAESVAVAERLVAQSVQNKQVPFVKDCALYRLGEYFEKTGIIETNVEFIRNLVDYVEKGDLDVKGN